MSGLPRSLIYQDDTQPGYLRKKWGRGHTYLENSSKLTDAKTLDWIRSLGIPPDWDDVWISKNPDGHLLATGYDAKGRKQYYYHPLWAEYRNQAKFAKLKLFGMALPLLRKQTEKDIALRGWPKEKVLALTVQVLDEFGIRIGNEKYKKENQTFGLTTLRRKHLEFERGTGRLEYKAKSGKYRKVSIKKGQLARLIKGCSELPGYEIFKYRGHDGKYHQVRSQDVNQYLQNIIGEEFTCKDFRTWYGTITAVEKLAEAHQLIEENPRLKLETTLIKLVAQALGNTLSICRKYYVHPKVLQAAVENKLDSYEKKACPSALEPWQRKNLERTELTVLKIIS
jgi:DNA topoisomerase-1